MNKTINILNEGFKKYESIQPSFEDQLYEAMKTLTEKQQEWSDEDKHDNGILWGIRSKWDKRINAALTPEEKEILKKYNIGEPYKNTYNELRVFSTDEKGLDQGNELFTNGANSAGRPYFEPNSRINIADRARKTVGRAKSKEGWNDDVRKYQSNYSDMKAAIAHRDSASNDLDEIERGNSYYDRKIKNLQKDIDSAIREKEWSRKYNQQKLKDSQDKINKLLKKDESLKEAKTINNMNESELVYLYNEMIKAYNTFEVKAQSFIHECVSDKNFWDDPTDAITSALFDLEDTFEEIADEIANEIDDM